MENKGWCGAERRTILYFSDIMVKWDLPEKYPEFLG